MGIHTVTTLGARAARSRLDAFAVFTQSAAFSKVRRRHKELFPD